MKELHSNLLKQNLEKRIELDISENNISGAAVIVRQNGEMIYKNCFGTTIPGSESPITEDTVFRLASMTKPITTVAVMILVDRGLLRLNDPVEDYLPEFKNMYIAACDDKNKVTKIKPAETKLNILHLLTHTSGIANGKCGEIYMSEMTDEDRSTLDKAVTYFSGLGLSFEPFSAQEYNPVAAFDVLAKIVETVTGEDYNDFLHKEIFAPCNMKDTTYVPNDSQWKRLIAMHTRENGKSSAAETKAGCVFGNYPCTHYLGGAGLVSTINDYSNFAEMLLNKGIAGEKQIISPKAVEAISTAQVPEKIQPGTERWGLGVRVITSEEYGILPVGAYGWSGAYGTHFWVDPENKITAIYMKNSLYDGGSGAVTAHNFEVDVYNSFKNRT